MWNTILCQFYSGLGVFPCYWTCFSIQSALRSFTWNLELAPPSFFYYHDYITRSVVSKSDKGVTSAPTLPGKHNRTRGKAKCSRWQYIVYFRGVLVRLLTHFWHGKLVAPSQDNLAMWMPYLLEVYHV